MSEKHNFALYFVLLDSIIVKANNTICRNQKVGQYREFHQFLSGWYSVAPRLWGPQFKIALVTK